MAKTTVALLGTLRDLHASMPTYDWTHLAQVVEKARPDLLCVEMDKPDWEAGNLASAPVEDAEALVPLSQRTEITLVPIGAGGRLWTDSGVAAPRRGVLAALRLQGFRLLDQLTVGLMRLAGGPRAVNSALVEHICGALCETQVLLADADAKRAWQTTNAELLEGVIWIVRRDPGRRVLVAVDCRRKHWLRRRLLSAPNIALVDFWRF
ncbi:MAG: hypothetical protein ACYC3S_10060 [Chloroflexota bacterium]